MTTRSERRALPLLPGLFVFIRHGIAVAAEDFAGADAERPLTDRGTRRTKAVCKRLAVLYRPTRVVSSPYVRAVETARLLVQATGTDGLAIETAPCLVPNGSLTAWREFVGHGAFAADDVVAVVSHEPLVGRLLAHQLGLSGALPFKKAGVAVVKPRGLTSGELVAFAPPKIWLGGP